MTTTTEITGSVTYIDSSGTSETGSYSQDKEEDGSTAAGRQQVIFNSIAKSEIESTKYLDASYAAGWLSSGATLTTNYSTWVAGSFLRVRGQYDDADPDGESSSITISTTGRSIEFYAMGGCAGVINKPSATILANTDDPEGMIPTNWFKGLQDYWIDTDFNDSLNAAASIAVWDATGSTAAVSPASKGVASPSTALEQALEDGSHYLNVVQGHSMTWADGYDLNIFEDYVQISLGNDDSVAALDVNAMFAYVNQASGPRFYGGKWPEMRTSGVLATTTLGSYTPTGSDTTTPGNYDSALRVEFNSNFNTLNGPSSYNPDNNFASRTFGTTWSTVTGNQVVYGTGSGDFNLGPTLEFNYPTRTGKYVIEISDEMIDELYWGMAYNKSYLDIVGANNKEKREQLVGRGIAESYTVIPEGEKTYNYSKGNVHELHVEDVEGKRRSQSSKAFGRTVEKAQKDWVNATTITNLNIGEQRAVNIFEKDVIGVNFGLDAVGVAVEIGNTGYTWKGPLKSAAGWAKYADPDSWEAQGFRAQIATGPWLAGFSFGVAGVTIDNVIMGVTPAINLKKELEGYVVSNEIIASGLRNKAVISGKEDRINLGATFRSMLVQGVQNYVKTSRAKVGIAELEAKSAPTAQASLQKVRNDALNIQQSSTLKATLGAIFSNIHAFCARC